MGFSQQLADNIRYDKFIVEGMDRLGKSTLIENIYQYLGFHQEIHYTKPRQLAFYDWGKHEDDADRKRTMLRLYQLESFTQGFDILRNTTAKLIMNRFHLGEVVYSPMYRGYDGGYVFDLEENFGCAEADDTLLILLTTTNFGFIVEDGNSFNEGDVVKRHNEQIIFQEAFDRSIFPNKVTVDVHDGKGGFRPALDIFHEAVSA